MTYGFVYFLINPSMPGLVKIGQTSKHPRARMKDLSRATACPEAFEMLAFFDTPDARFAEQEIHAELAEYRINDCREFFAVPFGALQTVARSWIDTAEGCANTIRLDMLADEEEDADIRAFLEKRDHG